MDFIADRLEEWNERASLGDARDELLLRGSKDWQLATDYVFGLASEEIQEPGLDVPPVPKGLAIATCLAGVSAVIGWALFLGVMSVSWLSVTVCAVPYLAFMWGYDRLFNAIGIAPKKVNMGWLLAGAVLIIAVVVGLFADFLLTVGTTLTMLMTTLGFVSCLAAWVRPEFRYRFSLLEMATNSSSGLEEGPAFLRSMIQVANAVRQLREANRQGPSQLKEMRELIGTTPGHRAYGLHPLALKDRRFAEDLEQLLADQRPNSMETA